MSILFTFQIICNFDVSLVFSQIQIKYWVVSKVLSVLMSCVCSPYLNKYLLHCVVVYTDRWRILYSLHRCCSFFPNINFLPLFCLLLYDVIKRFSANFSQRIQIKPKRCRNSPKQSEKLTRHLAMIVLMNALFDVGLRNFVPEILASKIISKVVDLQ